MQRQIVAVQPPPRPVIQEPASYGRLDQALRKLEKAPPFQARATYSSSEVEKRLRHFARAIGPDLPPDQQDIVDFLWFQVEGSHV